MKVKLYGDEYEIQMDIKDKFFFNGVFSEILNSLENSKNEVLQDLFKKFKNNELPFGINGPKNDLVYTIRKNDIEVLTKLGLESAFKINTDELPNLDNVSFSYFIKQNNQVLSFFFGFILSLKNAEIEYLKSKLD